MQGILLQSGYFERELSKRFKKVNFILLSNRMSSMLLSCTCMSCMCHPYVLVCHPYDTRMSLVCHHMSLVCHSYVIRISLACTRMSSICHSYVLYDIFRPLVCGFTMNRFTKNVSPRRLLANQNLQN